MSVGGVTCAIIITIVLPLFFIFLILFFFSEFLFNFSFFSLSFFFQKYKYEIRVMNRNIIKRNFTNHLLSVPSVSDASPVPSRQQHRHVSSKIHVRGWTTLNSLSSHVRSEPSLIPFKKNLLLSLLYDQFSL